MSVRMIRTSTLVVQVQIPVSGASDEVVGGTAIAVWQLNSDGMIHVAGSGGSGPAGAWVTPTALASQYECRWTLVAGSPTNTPGAAGAWLSLSASRSWTVIAGPGSGSFAAFLIEIRRAGGDGSIVASATINMTAISHDI